LATLRKTQTLDIGRVRLTATRKILPAPEHAKRQIIAEHAKNYLGIDAPTSLELARQPEPQMDGQPKADPLAIPAAKLFPESLGTPQVLVCVLQAPLQIDHAIALADTPVAWVALPSTR
jgi:hypothetical protein